MLLQGTADNSEAMTRVSWIEYAREQGRTLQVKYLTEDEVESAERVRIDAFARRIGVKLVEERMLGTRAQLLVTSDGVHILLPHDLAAAAERRWSIAHELGHFVLDHPAPPAKELCRPRTRRRRSDRRHQEDEANSFAAALLIPEPLLAAHCDLRPMTLEAPVQLATRCGLPWARCAQRLMEVSWRSCAFIVSHRGYTAAIAPSLPFLLASAGRIWRDEPLPTGSLAHRFFQTGEPCGPPTLVPASAWLAGVGPDVQLLEHSVGCPLADVVITMLWDPSESEAERPSEASFQAVAIVREQLLGEIEENPGLLAQVAATKPVRGGSSSLTW